MPDNPAAAGIASLGERLREDLFARRPMTNVRVVDAHAHMGPYSRFFIPQPDAHAMIRVMDTCGVALACIASHLAIELDASRGNEATLTAVDTHPDRLNGLLTVNPHQDPATEIARWADDPRFVGIKLHPDLHGYPLTGHRYTPAWDLARQRGMPVLVHTATGSAYDDPVMLGSVAEHFPDIALIMGHSGTTPDGFETAIELARRHENIHLEVCGSFMTSTWLSRLVDGAGAHRVLYGSDFPFIDMRYSLGRVLFADLDDEQLRLVLGGAYTALLPPTPASTAAQPEEA